MCSLLIVFSKPPGGSVFLVPWSLCVPSPGPPGPMHQTTNLVTKGPGHQSTRAPRDQGREHRGARRPGTKMLLEALRTQSTGETKAGTERERETTTTNQQQSNQVNKQTDKQIDGHFGGMMPPPLLNSPVRGGGRGLSLSVSPIEPESHRDPGVKRERERQTTRRTSNQTNRQPHRQTST